MNTMRRKIIKEEKFLQHLAQIAKVERRKKFTKRELEDIALQKGEIKNPLHWEGIENTPPYEEEGY